MIRAVVIFLAAVGALSFTQNASAITYYIDFEKGVNSNGGQTKTSAWKSHPYMNKVPGCTGGTNPNFVHSQGGDRFIFKGGVSWPAPCFSMHIKAGGSGGARDFYGLEPGYGAGLAIFDGGGQFPTPVSVNVGGYYFSMVVADSNIGPFDFDGFEIKNWKGLYPETRYTHYFGFQGGWNDAWIKNSKIHGWKISSDWTDSSTMPLLGCVAQASADNVECWQHTREELALVGKDFTGINRRIGRCWGSLLGAGEIKNSKCHDVASGVDSMAGPIHDSEFYNLSDECCNNYAVDFVNPMHTNVIQFQFPGGVAYNNLFHDIRSGQLIGSCALNMKIYNNVFWNVEGGGGGVFLADNRAGGNCYPNGGNADNTVAWIYNNSGICGSVPCVRSFANSKAKIYVDNNHWITNQPPYANAAGNYPVVDGGHNKTQSHSTASTQGYGTASKLVPPGASAVTVNAGADLGTFCGQNMRALCSDSRGAPWFGGSTKARPQGGTWDVGAYEYFGGSESEVPKSPSDLRVHP